MSSDSHTYTAPGGTSRGNSAMNHWGIIIAKKMIQEIPGVRPEGLFIVIPYAEARKRYAHAVANDPSLDGLRVVTSISFQGNEVGFVIFVRR